MKVTGPSSGPGAAGGARPSQPPAAAGGMAAITSPPAAGVSGADGVRAISWLDALIALQDAGGPLKRRRHATGEASGILHASVALKIEQLAGVVNPTVVEALAHAEARSGPHQRRSAPNGVLTKIATWAASALARLEGAKLTEHQVAT